MEMGQSRLMILIIISLTTLSSGKRNKIKPGKTQSVYFALKGDNKGEQLLLLVATWKTNDCN